MKCIRPVSQLLVAILFLCSLLPSAFASGSAREDMLPFYSNDGLSGLVRRLKRVESGIRVLHVAAHPDDEDSALLAWLSLGQGARVTYLSLTRGEGGQNLIGPEQGAELGVLRTSELLAARRLDGAQQLFGRMIDFGFSKSPEECFEKWGKENVVEDIVRAIRLTRPHIIICRFQGTSQDGHGQHQASAIAAREAFDKAADPNYLPDTVKVGLNSWQAVSFYLGSFDTSDLNALRIDTGDYDPIAGRSFAAIGYRGRSQHRSQDMGMIEYETPMRESAYFLEKPAHGNHRPSKDLFSGIKIEHRELREKVGGIYNLPNVASDPGVASDRIKAALKLWREQAPEDIEAICDLEHALAISLGIRTEAFSKTGHLKYAEELEVICNVLVPQADWLTAFDWHIFTSEDIEAIVDREKQKSSFQPFGKNPILQGFYKLSVTNNVPSVPYFMGDRTEGFLYARTAGMNTAMPFEVPSAIAQLLLEVDMVPLVLRLPVEVRTADPAFGEIREDLQIVPVISGRFENPVMVMNKRAPDAGDAIKIHVTASKEFEGKLSLKTNSKSIASNDISLKAGQETAISFPISAMPELDSNFNAPMELALLAQTAEGTQPIYDVRKLDYRHIRPRYLTVPARAELHGLDVALPADFSVGYVPGAKDAVAQTLDQLGLELTVLHEGDLASAELSKFDAIVLGARVYEVRSDLAANNIRLMEYVEQGGTLVVQYNQYDYADQNLAPRPIKMRRPHDRVTDEDAKITLLKPEHPIFNSPNKIVESDFEDWVQERGLYFCFEWDAAYEPLMSCADPPEQQQKGGMLYLPLGKGHFFYTGYSFFRQIPAGHEGAIKLFVNMISMGQDREASK